MGRVVVAAALLATLAACLDGPRGPRRADAGAGRAAPVATRSDTNPAHRPAPPIPTIGKRRPLPALDGMMVVAVRPSDHRGHPGEIVGANEAGTVFVGVDGAVRRRVATPHGIPYLAALLPLEAKTGPMPLDALVAWGYGRGHLDDRLSLVGYGPGGGEVPLDSPPTERNQPVDLVPLDAEGSSYLWAYYESKYMVHVGMLAAGTAGGTGTRRDLGAFRMADAFAVADFLGTGKPQIAVGRLYGDSIDAPGDAFLLDETGKRLLSIPTTRGVHALAAADLDGDGRPELYMADGWDKSYGQNAHALLTRVTFQAGAPHAALVEDLPGELMLTKLAAGDLDGDGRPELCALGNAYLRCFQWTPAGFRGQTVAGPVSDFALGDLDGDGADEIVTVDAHSEALSLRGAPGLFAAR